MQDILRAWVSTRQHPLDVVRFLKRRLGEIFKNRQEALHVDYVTNIRDYEKELPKSSSIYGIFKKRKGDDMQNRIVPHSFTFVRRERHLYALRPSLSLRIRGVGSRMSCCAPSSGLPQQVLQGADENLPRRHPPNMSDVFVFVKRYISDTDYCQAPLVVFPGAILGDTLRALRNLATSNCQGAFRDETTNCKRYVLLFVAS